MDSLKSFLDRMLGKGKGAAAPSSSPQTPSRRHSDPGAAAAAAASATAGAASTSAEAPAAGTAASGRARAGSGGEGASPKAKPVAALTAREATRRQSLGASPVDRNVVLASTKIPTLATPNKAPEPAPALEGSGSLIFADAGASASASASTADVSQFLPLATQTEVPLPLFGRDSASPPNVDNDVPRLRAATLQSIPSRPMTPISVPKRASEILPSPGISPTALEDGVALPGKRNSRLDPLPPSGNMRRLTRRPTEEHMSMSPLGTPKASLSPAVARKSLPPLEHRGSLPKIDLVEKT